ncbi:Telomere repeat-binding factor, dimerization domain protein [Ophiocordyceps camponoti-floridani]|uniref:Telomere repeat-binding factor, dimerization domain protein n=1 Tax=Ophiocordyceps camponoti-floridani TaxID=2030778 RepID=A0A8H4Q4X5_9HYPO|nr:Telomere repeat-binding factor, dimerization domain protein [Ophiocordyceps camponoti-floridani]
MAEPAQLQHVGAPYVKQECEPDVVQLAGQAGTKRPLDPYGRDEPQAKRTRTTEEPFDDGLALLVQNALSSVGDLVDQFNAESATVDVPQDTPCPAFSSDPQAFVRDMSLHSLGNMALSLLHIYIQKPLQVTLASLRDGGCDQGRCYRQLRRAFEQIRLIFTAKPVMSAKDMDLRGNEGRAVVELVNLAQLGSWLVDGSLEALFAADENFLELFSCQVADLPPGMTELYLGIMAQRAVESLVVKDPEKPVEQVLGEVLMGGLEDKLKRQHHDDELTLADKNFVTSVLSWKETLEREAREQAEPTALREMHPFICLLRSFVCYVKMRVRCESHWSGKFGILLQLDDEDEEAEAEGAPPDDDSNRAQQETTGLDLDEISSFLEKETNSLVQNALAGLAEGGGAAVKTDGETTRTNGKADLMTDYKELEALVAESTSHYVKTTLNGLSPVPYQPTVPQSTAEAMAAQHPYSQQGALHPYYAGCLPPVPADAQAHQQAAPGEDLPPNQTFPSAILYDKARQAALSKTTAHTRREGLHSTRRPWSQEEEKALMAGLDMVKGPHWSQILTLFGHNGTMSDILKDRTQVQLKDKARNLKLFFLKTNSEMPYYLQAVTGELKTRAPTQAARKEAEVRARQNSDEDQAKLQGIMALAGGLQDPPGPQAKATAAAQGQQAREGGATTQQPAAKAGTTTTTTMPMTTPTTTQQVLQAMPQAPPRPQSQLPRPPMSLPAAAIRPRLAPAPGPGPNPQAAPMAGGSEPSRPAAQQTPLTQQQAAAPPRPAATAPPPATASGPQEAHVVTETNHVPPAARPAQQPRPPSTQQGLTRPPTESARDDVDVDGTEAALLEGLQAVVAQTLA